MIVTLPAGLQSIGDSAFVRCPNLWHVLYKGSEEMWDAISVNYNNQHLTSAAHHYNYNGSGEPDVENKICSVCFGDCDHVWNDGVVKKEPTCTEDGQMRYTCGKCEKTKSEAISALGH